VDLVMLEDGAALVSWLERTGGEWAEVRLDGRSNGTATSRERQRESVVQRASGFPRLAAPADGSVLAGVDRRLGAGAARARRAIDAREADAKGSMKRALGCFVALSSEPRSVRSRGYASGTRARRAGPSSTCATTLEGDSVSLESLRGEVVLLNLWATWCVPCRTETPYLQELFEEHRAPASSIVGISMDTRTRRTRWRCSSRNSA
jgi:hypothetical protein